MKNKTILAALSCMMLAVMACDKGDSPVQDSIQVNTAALYEELGIKSEMTQALASGDYVLTDTLLVYDAAGSLVKKLGAESNSLEPLSFSAEGLSNGTTYTLVLWQTARSKDGERVWKLDGEEQLSTAMLHQKKAPIGFAYSAGYATSDVATKGVSMEPVLTPMAIGTVIDLRVDNLEAMPEAKALSLWGTDLYYLTGIYLAPALDEDGRWYSDPEGKLSSRVGQLPVGQTEGKFFTLYHGSSSSFEIWADTETEEGEEYITNLTYQPIPNGRQSICYINIERRKWETAFLGSPEAFKTWKAERDALIPVTDPYLKWGCDSDEVFEHIWNKMCFYPGNSELEYWDEYESWHHWFRVAGDLTEQYLYETEDGENLRFVLCYCWDADAPAELRNNLLAHQGFKATGKEVMLGEYAYEQFLSTDGQTEALAQSEGGCWEIIYRPVTK